MSLQEILSKATKEHWSTGHFNASESDQMRAIVKAAKEVGASAIVGTSEGEANHLGYEVAVGIRDGLRKEFDIPIFLNADHHKSVEAAKHAIDARYDSIHIDLSALPFEENVRGTRDIVEYARSKFSIFNFQFSIEGELGYLRGDSKIQKEKIEVKPEDYTNPDEAKKFVEAAGVNRLAIAVGNIHGISLDEPALDIERIRAIRAAVPEEVALVLHAGSGIPEDQIKAAIAAGIANIHINTDIRVAYTEALRKELSEKPGETAPYKFDASAREVLKSLIMEKLKLFKNQ
ncbi:MAG: Ketose-bisphosphate aldolase, class-II [Parcubacteria group bacterium GW2011_GWB1_52_7]|nr:MAG: Ketose-bisphosphate aldolase, class-II [Parcubacteria group bacterium GW2011_GWB1_52_7]